LLLFSSVIFITKKCRSRRS